MKARNLKQESNLGFTLVELIITLVILGILSVTVIPKFFGPDLFDSYTARDQAMSALRTMQLRAMQNTNSDKCHQFIITADLIAPPSPIDTDYECSHSDINTASAADNPSYLVVELDSSRTDVTFTVNNANGASFSILKFDQLGKTNLTCMGTADYCKITVGEVGICISDQGAIYGC